MWFSGIQTHNYVILMNKIINKSSLNWFSLPNFCTTYLLVQVQCVYVKKCVWFILRFRIVKYYNWYKLAWNLSFNGWDFTGMSTWFVFFKISINSYETYTPLKCHLKSNAWWMTFPQHLFTQTFCLITKRVKICRH